MTRAPVFPERASPDPQAVACTRWGGDGVFAARTRTPPPRRPGDDYDELGRPRGASRSRASTLAASTPTRGRASSPAGAARTPCTSCAATPESPSTRCSRCPRWTTGPTRTGRRRLRIGRPYRTMTNRTMTNWTMTTPMERKKRKGKKKKRRRGDDDGPEDDDAARERARVRLAREAAERREQLERDAKEATEGKEEVKKVLRLLGDGFNGFTGSVAKHVRDEEHTFDAFCALSVELETHSGRRAFVDALAAETFPELKRDAWANERDGLRTLVRWMEHITTRRWRAPRAMHRAAVEAPRDLSAIRARAPRVSCRSARPPTPAGSALLARKCARGGRRRAPRKAAARAGDGDDARLRRGPSTRGPRTHVRIPRETRFSDAPPLEVAVAGKKKADRTR